MIVEFKGIKPDLHDSVFVAETAAVIGDVKIGADSSVWYSAVVRGDMHYIKIGERTNIQDSAVLHVVSGKLPLEIGNDVTIGHAAVVHACTVHDKVLIGMNATVLDGATIEEGSIVAAGAVVLEGQVVRKDTLVAGIPAREMRSTTESDWKRIMDGSDEYVLYKELFKKESNTL